MGYSIWQYRKTSDSRIVPIAQNLANAFLNGERPIPTKNNQVLLASVCVELENRKFLSVIRIDCIRRDTLPNGMIDPDSHLDLLRNAIESVEKPLGRLRDDKDENVVNAKHLFARQRFEVFYSWRPTNDDWIELWKLVMKRTGGVEPW